MDSQPIPMDPKYIIDLVINGRWLVVIPFVLAMLVGIYLSIALPKIYEATTLILIQPQRVPENYVQSIVETEPTDRISTLSQQVLSRTNLEKIIREFKLYSDPENAQMYIEDKLKDLREKIAVSVSSDRRRETDSFSITFQDENPDTVMKVTNALASFFIDENLRQREAQAIGTSDFLDAELQSMKKRLEQVEAQLKGYRENYMGELPEQLESNLRILDRLQERLGENQQSYSEAKIRLVNVQNQAASQQSTTVIIGDQAPEEPADIERMRTQLDSLLSRYTPRHPDVMRLRARIAEMEAKRSARLQALDTPGAAKAHPELDLSPEFRAQYFEALQEMRRLEADIAETKQQVKIYQIRVENTPKREQELLGLRRDYQNIQSTYESLLERKLEAEIAVNMERKQKGEQFRILDPAKRPEKPVKPDMRKLFIIVVGAALAIGAGLIFAREYMDNSIKRMEEIEVSLDLPVLCALPQIIDSKARMKRRMEHILFGVAGGLSFLLFIGFALLTQKGVAPTLELARNLAN